MDLIQQQYHELNLTIISPLKLTLKIFMFILFEIIYSLRYNTLITENWDV